MLLFDTLTFTLNILIYITIYSEYNQEYQICHMHGYQYATWNLKSLMLACYLFTELSMQEYIFKKIVCPEEGTLCFKYHYIDKFRVLFMYDG